MSNTGNIARDTCNIETGHIEPHNKAQAILAISKENSITNKMTWKKQINTYSLRKKMRTYDNIHEEEITPEHRYHYRNEYHEPRQ